MIEGNKKVSQKALAGKRILMIMSDKYASNMLKQHLTKYKAIVMLAYDGVSGLKKIEEKKYDLIILDILFPGLNGYEIITKIKERHLSEAPIIILTNLSSENYVKKAFELGVSDYLLLTEITPDDFVNIIGSNFL